MNRKYGFQIPFLGHQGLISHKALSWFIRRHVEVKVRWMPSWQRCRRRVR